MTSISEADGLVSVVFDDGAAEIDVRVADGYEVRLFGRRRGKIVMLQRKTCLSSKTGRLRGKTGRL